MSWEGMFKVLSAQEFDSSKITGKNEVRVLAVPLRVFRPLGSGEGLWLLLAGRGIPLPSNLRTSEAQSRRKGVYVAALPRGLKRRMLPHESSQHPCEVGRWREVLSPPYRWGK